MLESLMQAFRIPELKRRIYFNLMMFAIFVLGAHIPVPGIDHDKLEQLFGGGGQALGLIVPAGKTYLFDAQGIACRRLVPLELAA